MGGEKIEERASESLLTLALRDVDPFETYYCS